MADRPPRIRFAARLAVAALLNRAALVTEDEDADRGASGPASIARPDPR